VALVVPAVPAVLLPVPALLPVMPAPLMLVMGGDEGELHAASAPIQSPINTLSGLICMI
jgi:hypothetical protein